MFHHTQVAGVQHTNIGNAVPHHHQAGESETERETGPLIGVDSANVLVHGAKKLVALVGVRDLIVVETEDALLICRRGASQDVKKAVTEIEGRGWKEFL